ncbi:MAG: hypothetical protein DRP45_01670 [Candidatus Zixiibacteriota bacterium]|nr:MAG: hypothetical protein DRP45_01670 [candidate division Zixibacteria bacterium]
MEELLSRIGQLFIIGYPSEEPPERFKQFVANKQIGGFILFGDNCTSGAVVRRAVESLKSCCRTALPFVSIDQEGGRTSRLTKEPAQYGAASAYAETNNIGQFTKDYTSTAAYMKSLGINYNLAPVADIFLEEQNTCMDGRCYGRTAEQVASFVQAAVTVNKQHGLFSCLKHFPGLGAAAIDPHKATAIADYDHSTWAHRERIPFVAGIDVGAETVMTTHMQLPSVDHEIVTGSRTIVSRWLRDDLGFDGLVITDELCMLGAEALGSVGERAVAAFCAGHDLLLFGQDYDVAMEAYEYFAGSVQDGRVSAESIRTSLDRIAAVKLKLGNTVVS